MTTKISVYNLDSSVTTAIGASGGGPKIQTIVYPGNDTAVNTAGGDVVILNGTGFVTGCTIIVNGSLAGSVTFNSSSNVQFTAPAQSSGGYPIYLVNPDGGTAIAVPGLQYSGVPNWTTASGSLGSIYETTAFANTVVALGDAPISYNVVTGTLPDGATLNVSSGLISGTSNVTSSSTTYNFTIRATDGQNQDTDRAFSLTVNPDVVTWSSPANNITYSVFSDVPISSVTLSATSAAGYGVQYAANTLPTGLTLSGNTISGTPTVVGNTNTLVTATANTTTRSTQQIINWVISAGVDTFFKSVTTLLSANNSVTPFNKDESANNFAITVNGDTRPNNFNPYTPGYYSVYFDGASDYIRTTGAAMNSSTFTISFYFYPTTSSVIGLFDSAPGTASTFRNYPGNTIQDQNGGSVSFIPNVNQWNWMSIVGSGGTFTVYLNGVSVGSSSYDSLAVNNFTIGTINSGGDGSYTGYISNFRIKNVASVDPVPTSPLTAISGTTFLACHANRYIDGSTNNFTITKNGETFISGFDPFIPDSNYATYGSTYFDGSGDYLTVPDNTSLEAFGDFTIEFWVYFNSVSGTQIIVDKGWNGSSIAPYMIFAEGTNLRMYASSDGSNWNVLSGQSLGTVAIGQWFHGAVTRSGSDIRLFLNGVLNNTITNSNVLMNGTSALGIGGGPSAGASPLNGYISDLRIVKGTAVYTSAFTPPTAPLTAIANTSLLTCRTNLPVNNKAIIDNSTNNFLVTRNGNISQGTFSPYGEGYSVYYDGSSYLSLPSGDYINYGTGNFTVEFWINTTGSGGLFASPSTVTTNAWDLSISGGNLVWRNRLTATTVWSYSSSAITDGKWHHVTISRQGSSSRLFYDGSLVATNTDNTNWDGNEAGKTFTIGTSGLGNFTGHLSNVRFTKGIAIYTDAFTPSTTPLSPLSGYTSLLICQSDRFTDNSASNRTLTANGNVSVQRYNPFNITTLTSPAYSVYFDGNGDYLTLPSALSTSGDFTLEFWAYRMTDVSSFMILFSNGGNSGWVGWTTNNTTFVWDTIITATIPETKNTWAHFALTKQGTTARLFVNGTLYGSATTSSNLTFATIGAFNNNSYYMNGYLSNIRVVNGTALYTANFTPTTSPLTAISGTSLLTCQSTTFVDNSTNNFAITANGNSQPTQFNPFTLSYSTNQQYSTNLIGGSMYFDGTGDYLDIANSPLNQLSGSSYTIEMWLYPTTSGTERRIFNKNGATTFGYLLYLTTGNVLCFRTDSTNMIGTATVNANTWTHVAVTHDGTTTRIFVNGVLSTSATGVTITSGNEQGVLRIGARQFDATFLFAGYMSDVRLVKGRALYRSNFVPPNAPVTAVSNTTLLLSGTSSGIYDASGMGNLETVGDAKLNTSISKFTGGSSMYFDGTGDYLVTYKNTNLYGAPQQFTAECWVYVTNTGVTNGIMGTWNGSGGTSGWTITCTNTFNLRFGSVFFNSTWYYSGLGSISANTWTHIAFVRTLSGTNNRMLFFVNGVGVLDAIDGTSDTRYTGSPAEGFPFAIGAASTATNDRFNNDFGFLMNGYISDVRITRGVARYTSNFTPATTPFISK